MLSDNEESTLREKESKGNVSRSKATSSHSDNNDRSDDGALSANEIRVKAVSKINADFNTSNIGTHLNGNGNARKRESSVSGDTSSKRSKSYEKDDADDIEGACDAQINNSDDNSAAGDIEDVKIKSETDADSNDVGDSHGTKTCGTIIKVKSEPLTEDADVLPSSSNSTSRVNIKPVAKVEKADASSTTRASCRFGIRCYRRNPIHRIEEAHPGDHDYRRPSYPTPPLGTPDCPYGDRCYRRNPAHFEQFSHPPETDFDKNYKLRLRQRRLQGQSRGNAFNTNRDSSESSNEDFEMEEPFSADECFDSDYALSGSEEDDDDYDACDRAEE